MLYIFIDESGDIGNPNIGGNSRDFSLGTCFCYSATIEHLMEQITKLRIRLKKKEIKFSKLSTREKTIIDEYVHKLPIEHCSVYRVKTNNSFGSVFLKSVFKELIMTIPEIEKCKVKIFFDGTENSHFRKIYEPILRKRFPRSTLHFVNSVKTPLVQIADFYAGKRRKLGK